jgi:hypothetical protein
MHKNAYYTKKVYVAVFILIFIAIIFFFGLKHTMIFQNTAELAFFFFF